MTQASDREAAENFIKFHESKSPLGGWGEFGKMIARISYCAGMNDARREMEGEIRDYRALLKDTESAMLFLCDEVCPNPLNCGPHKQAEKIREVLKKYGSKE